MEEDSDAQALSHTRSLGHNQFSSFLQSTPETVKVFFEIKKLLEGVDSFYVECLLTKWKGRQLEILVRMLKEEREALESGRSFYHKTMKAITARSNCLCRVKQKMAKLEPSLQLLSAEDRREETRGSFTRQEGYSLMGVEEEVESTVLGIRSLFAELSQLRDMTLYIVQSIHAWRVELEAHAERCKQHRPLAFLAEGGDFLLTVAQDSLFVWGRPLDAYMRLPHKDDCFFVRNVAALQDHVQLNVLERYFVQMLYPKQDDVLTQALQCIQILAYKHQPKLFNFYEEEQKLIATYLEIADDQRQKEKEKVLEYFESPAHNKHLRGWVFEQPIRLPHQSAKERVKELVRSHKHSMNIIKPFSIANYNERTSIALAYLSEHRQTTHNYSNHKHHSEGEEVDSQSKPNSAAPSNKKKTTMKKKKSNDKGYSTDSEEVRQNMFASLTHLHPVIEQDPHQNEPDTPKPTSEKKTVFTAEHKQNIFNTLNFPDHDSAPNHSRLHSTHHIKVNSFQKGAQQSDPFIQVDEDQSPLDLKQFLQVFRSETNKPIKRKQKQNRRQSKKEENNQGPSQLKPQQRSEKEKRSLAVKQALQEFKQRSQSLNSKNKKILIELKKSRKQEQKQIVEAGKQGISVWGEQKIDLKQQYIWLKAKTIPFELIDEYVDYLLSQQFDSNKSFTRFNFQEIGFSLKDPFSHSLIFDLYSGSDEGKQEHVGQTVLAERWNKHSNRLTYNMHFIHASTFEKLVSAIVRVSQELLSVTPCRELQCNFVVDKADPVSTHFIRVLDAFLARHTAVKITELPRLTTSTLDLHERVYTFTSDVHLPKQLMLDTQMMSNYRSLSFKSTSLVLTSNFRLRSKKMFRPDAVRYRSYSVGQLYVRLLTRVMTRFHLKQLRIALTAESTITEPGILYQNAFNCSLLHQLAQRVEKIEEADDSIKVTRFQSMPAMLQYLSYKQYDQYFKFDFLADSRFILDHQLLLAEFEAQFSLEFVLHATQSTYHIRNYKHLLIECVSSHLSTSKAYLLPTTDTNIRLFLMDATPYLSAQTDLFSYLTSFFKQMHSTVKIDLPEIVLPNLGQYKSETATIRCFEGLIRLFVERQFYSTALLSIVNHWQNYYNDAVVRIPGQHALLLDYPLLLGFYCKEELLSCFLLNPKGKQLSSKKGNANQNISKAEA